MTKQLAGCVLEVQAIAAVPQVLATVASLTGVGFVAVAHVTADSWTACAVHDTLGFGLAVGDGLDVTTTLCEEVRSQERSIVIDHVRESGYCDHHTPRMYGFQSYFSVPLYRPDGAYFGTLCGLDPQPATLSTPSIVSTLELFAQLISSQLEAERRHADTRTALLSERETSELREQFIAVLGHDLRTPLSSLQFGIELLRMKHAESDMLPVLQRMQRSVARMSALVDNVVDFARGRLGGGIALDLRHETDIDAALRQVVDELRQLHPGTVVVEQFEPVEGLVCDLGRLGQLLSNLLKNAIVHGQPGAPVRVVAGRQGGDFALSVHNQGGPLPPLLVDQLFKPFKRVTATSSHDGLGLGLYIVSEIARAHGGGMEVQGRGGEVSFTFRMPLTDATGRAQPSRTAIV
ncbi:MAG: sensor histidine kinase [Gammaproteobacteria bacterium]